MIQTLGDYVVQTAPRCDDILPMSVDDAIGCTAVIISGQDLAHVLSQFGDAIPWPHVARERILDGHDSCDDVSVSWFGDHARFIAANWRR